MHPLSPAAPFGHPSAGHVVAQGLPACTVLGVEPGVESAQRLTLMLSDLGHTHSLSLLRLRGAIQLPQRPHAEPAQLR